MNTVGHPQRGDVTLQVQVAELIRELGNDASAMFDRPIPVGKCSRVRSAKAMLDLVWDSAMAEMTRSGTDLVPRRLAELTELLGRVREAESRVDDARVAESIEIMRRIRRALSQLDSASTVDELLALAATETCTLGFDRALISTVDDATWNLHTMYIEKDPALASEMVEAGRQNPPKLDGTIIESDIVTRARPGLVYDVQANPRVNRQLVALSKCTSYGVAPLRSHGQVVGLVHADSHYARRMVDATDRAVLNLYAEGLGHSLARVSMLEGLATLTASITRLTGNGRSPGLVDAAQSQPDPPRGLLSTREVEVIELMAAGNSNRSIARTLCISEGTVKTHITHIFRKLDASNRAEAVAYWLRN